MLSPMQGSSLGIFDLENVQVLRAPQGTLFGRNTTAGAVLFTTASPLTSSRAASGWATAILKKTATAVLTCLSTSKFVCVRRWTISKVTDTSDTMTCRTAFPSCNMTMISEL